MMNEQRVEVAENSRNRRCCISAMTAIPNMFFHQLRLRKRGTFPRPSSLGTFHTLEMRFTGEGHEKNARNAELSKKHLHGEPSYDHDIS